ncbi:hypothetical protein, partial [Mycobacterium pseudoshottsii]|uniref:hypothetical protein n=1 Tax=Mycobacterium pseudoshottsii TaxID=265949 RepID=UPI001F319264
RSPDSPCLHSGPNSAAPKIINPAHKPANQRRRSPGHGPTSLIDLIFVLLWSALVAGLVAEFSRFCTKVSGLKNGIAFQNESGVVSEMEWLCKRTGLYFGNASCRAFSAKWTTLLSKRPAGRLPELAWTLRTGPARYRR